MTEIKLRSYGLARVQAIRTLNPDGELRPGVGEVELFITGTRHYLTPDEARAVGEALIAETQKLDAERRYRAEEKG
jgi:hypothetical protein